MTPVVVGLVVWYVLGCVVLAAIDEDERLRLWARSGPLGEGGVALVVMAWPVFLWLRAKEGR